MFYHLSKQTTNSKLGFGISASTSDIKTCPNSCPLKGKTCYASMGPLAIHWKAVSDGKRGTDWTTFVNEVSTLPRGWKLRLFQAGDTPTKVAGSEVIDAQAMKQLAKVVKARKLQTFGYTHKKMGKSNVNLIKTLAKDGLVINASADSMKEVDEFRTKGIPTVVTVPTGFKSGTVTPAGNKIIICPNQTKEGGITCSECMLCAKANRSVVIGFLSHGSRKKELDKCLTNQ